jgi:dTDP-4-dehydrorhamnose 3,5-epimerase-like enzyme
MPYVKQLELKEAILKDGRGWTINPLKISDIPAKSLLDLHLVSIKPGTIRGNHHHPDATEWLLTCGGLASLVWRQVGNDKVNQFLTEGEEPTLFEIPPGCEHAIKNLSNDDIYLMVFYDVPSPNVVRCLPFSYVG